MNTEPTLFARIISKELPAEFVYEDDKCVVIKDINPRARVHLLIIPKKPIPTLFDLKPEDKDLMGHMMLLLPQIAQSQNLDGFKTQIHTGESGGQEVFHVHIHLLGN